MATNQQENSLLFGTIAKGSPDEARKLLVSRGRQDARNVVDLQKKLMDLYFDDKTNQSEFEKELAKIHPHSQFILKRLAPEPKKEDVKPAIVPLTKEEIEKIVSDKAHSFAGEQKSNCDSGGCSNCRFAANSSFSGFAGNVGPQANTDKSSHYIMPITILGLVVVTGLTFYFLKQTVKA